MGRFLCEPALTRAQIEPSWLTVGTVVGQELADKRAPKPFDLLLSILLGRGVIYDKISSLFFQVQTVLSGLASREFFPRPTPRRRSLEPGFLRRADVDNHIAELVPAGLQHHRSIQHRGGNTVPGHLLDLATQSSGLPEPNLSPCPTPP